MLQVLIGQCQSQLSIGQCQFQIFVFRFVLLFIRYDYDNDRFQVSSYRDVQVSSYRYATFTLDTVT